MARHRITQEFEATTGNPSTAGSRAGWSETWYRNLDEPDADALAAARTLANRRKGLLTEGWSLTAIRVSRLDAAANLIRRGVLYLVPPADQPGRYNNGVAVAGVDEQPYDAIDLAINSTGGNRRAFLMRGIGNDVISPGGRFLNPARWSANWTDFWGFVTNQIIAGPQAQGWSLRVRTAIANPDAFSNRFPIGNVDLVGAIAVGSSRTRPAVQLLGVYAVPAGSTVVISGASALSALNGTWLVDLNRTVGGNTWLLLKAKRGTSIAGTPAPDNGSLLAYSYQLDNIALMTAGNGASRRTGRPLQTVRGRRSARRS